MAGIKFTRFDLKLIVDSKNASLVLTGRAPEKIPLEPLPDIAKRVLTSETMHEWKKLNAENYPYEALDRILLDIREPKLQEHPWELWLQTLNRTSLSNVVIMRVTPVRPRTASLPFTLPMRFLDINPSGNGDAFTAISKVFHGNPLEKYASAIQWEDRICFSWDDPRLNRPGHWPGIDILHFGKIPDVPSEKMFSGDARIAGSVGWFVERLIRWQVRLLVLHAETVCDLDTLRKFAAAILGRGGPAILVEYFQNRQAFFNRFYEQLIHDYPVDWCWNQGLFPVETERLNASLYGGAGRTEALRVSKVASALNDISWMMPEDPRRKAVFDIFSHGLTGKNIGRVTVDIESALKEVQTSWPTSKYEFRESDAMVPLGNTLNNLRVGFGRRLSTLDVSAPERPLTAKERGARFVNATFSLESSTGELLPVDQASGSFERDTIYHLGIQIGPRNVRVITIHGAALIEEVFKWSPEMKGVWIEIGITGIDFEVIGDPVQRLWLPREGPTETVYFAVTAKKEGACRLRFSLYYEQNVVQSFRIAVVVGSNPEQKRSALLSRALGEKTKIDAAFLPMLEYSLAPSVDQFVASPGDLPERTLSIISNDHEGISIITVKGPGSFDVNISDRLPGYVTNLQNELHEVSGKESYPYDNVSNEGTVKVLESALRQLADRGRDLYNDLFDSDQWETLNENLDKPDCTIQVAQILREKVIPWAFIYSRDLQGLPGDRDAEGKLTEMPVCLAALPNEDGALPVVRCGDSAQCLLKQDLQGTRAKENIICPLEFWGFKHVIEIPPQQVKKSKQSSGASVPKEIEVNQEVRILAGANATFHSEQLHFKNINNLKSNVKLQPIQQEYVSARIKTELARSPLHVAYFFCHADGGAKARNARLIFQGPDPSQPDPILAHEFGGLLKGQKWKPPTLVFLNACGTSNYSPEAVSPFLRSFVDQLGASGIIGTEISVWDVFAAEFAEFFLKQFLDCQPAGKALLIARRKMLHKMNPLGLLYTLYAYADLRLKIVN